MVYFKTNEEIKQTAIDAVALALCSQDFKEWECREDKELFSNYQLMAERSLKSVSCDVDTKKCIAKYALSRIFKKELTKVDIGQGILALFGIGMTGCLPEGHPPEEMTDVPFDMPRSLVDAGAEISNLIEDLPYNARPEDSQKAPDEDANLIGTETLLPDGETEESKDVKATDKIETSLKNDTGSDTGDYIDIPHDQLAPETPVFETSADIKPVNMCDADGDGIITNDIKDPALLDAIREALGKGPDEDITLEEAQKLTKLVANGKGIKDLSGIECFSNLVELQLSNNQISDVTPLAGIETLKHLWLDGNNVSNGDPLANLINIEWLFLSNNPISDISFVASLENLVWFEAMACNIMDVSPFSNSKKIAKLLLDGNLITDISSLAGVISLDTLTIHNNFVSDISAVSGLMFLKVFGAGGNGISDIYALSGLLFLKIVSLYSNQIEDITALIENSGFGAGDTADLGNNPKIPSEQIETLKAKGVAVSW